MLKVQPLLCPLGAHMYSCTRSLQIVLNVLLLAIGVGILYACCAAYLDLALDLFLLYHYAPLNVIIITAAACILILAPVLNLISLLRQSFPGLLTGAIILSLLVLSTLGVVIWRAVVEDYTPKGKVFQQLVTEFNNSQHHKALLERLVKTLECTNAITCFPKLRRLISYYNWMILIGFGFLCGLGVTTVTLSYVICRAIRHAKRHQKEAVVEESNPEPKTAEPEPEPEPESTPEPAAEPEPEPEAASAPPPPPPPPGDQ